MDENIFLCSSTTLSEWLCIRGESTMASAALKDAQTVFHSIQQISSDQILQYQAVRLVMVDMKLQYLYQNYEQVLYIGDNVTNNLLQVKLK